MGQADVEIPLTGGWSTDGVVRVADTVRRPAHPRSSFVRTLLDQLAEVGFTAVPRFLGFDEKGREMLRYLEGDVPHGCRDITWTDEQLKASARLLRSFHDATTATSLLDGHEVVCHGDFGPWNMIWRSNLPVAMIDFDEAAPGRRLDDLGHAAWKHLNLGLIDLPVSEQARRLELFAAAYGAPRDGRLIAALGAALERRGALAEEADWFAAHGPRLADPVT
jgi:aminoglycoside phosphotransferase (APT) family kinase protein